MINRVYKATLQTLGGGREQIQKGAEVSPIKYGTFHYAATAGNPAQYGKGGAFSSYIEFEYYKSGGVTLTKGDMLLYAQEWDTDTSFAEITPSREQGINLFYVSEIKEKRETYSVLAYDMVKTRLDVDFSETLKTNKSSFPMTIDDLCTLVYNLTGVFAPWHTIIAMSPERSNYWRKATVDYFYSPNITARDIYNWIGEIVGAPLLALWSGDMALYGTSKQTKSKTFGISENEYWQDADKYIVCPGDSGNAGIPRRLVTANGDYLTNANGDYLTVGGVSGVRAWYKENGLEIFDPFPTYDGVDIIASDGELLGTYRASTPASNVLTIKKNLIVENINTFANIFSSGVDTGIVGTFDDLAEDILGHANMVAGMTYAQVHLFPFRCPYTVGSRMYCVDTNGNSFIVPIMSIDLTDREVIIGAFRTGTSKVDGNDFGSESDGLGSQDLWAKVNGMELQIGLYQDTTSSSGNIRTDLDADYVVVSAMRRGTTSLCIPYFNASDGIWGIHVTNMSSSAITNTSVQVFVAYFKKRIQVVVPN